MKDKHLRTSAPTANRGTVAHQIENGRCIVRQVIENQIRDSYFVMSCLHKTDGTIDNIENEWDIYIEFEH